MKYTPAQTERMTVVALTAIGAGMFLLFTTIAGWSLWSKMRLPETHVPATVTVSAVDTLCEVQQRSGKQWRLRSVHACDAASKVVAENSGGLSAWRSVEVPYALVTYTAAGAPQEKLLRAAELPVAEAKVGDQMAMYVDPADPLSIERPIQDGDYSTFWLLAGVGAAIGLGTALLGRVLGRWNRNRQEATLAVGGTVNENGSISVPQTTAAGQTVTLAMPLWAKILNGVAVAILVVGVAIAALAAVGSATSAESGNGLFGAVVIAGLSLAIWRLLRMIAAFGAKPQIGT